MGGSTEVRRPLRSALLLTVVLLVGFVAFVVTAVSTMLSRSEGETQDRGIDRGRPTVTKINVVGQANVQPTSPQDRMAKQWNDLVAARNARLDGKQIGIQRNGTGGRRFVIPHSTAVDDIPGVVPLKLRDPDAVSGGGVKAMYARKKGSPAASTYTEEQLNAMHQEDLIIVSWVNGSDPVHQYKKADLQQRPTTMISSRDRDSGELRAGLRSIHTNMPWHVGPIVIVSPGTVPNWLNLADDRISVMHQDAMTDDPQERYTANTNTVEQTLYRVPGATPTYLHFNDDYLVQRPTTAAQFFDPHGGGPALLFEANVVAGSGSALAALKRTKKIWLASVYNTHAFAEQLFGRGRRYFIKHAPFSYCRSIAAGVHAQFQKDLHQNAVSHPFRDHSDVLFPFLHHYVSLEGPDVAYNAVAAAYPNVSHPTCAPAVGRVGDRANSTLIILGNNEAVSQATLNRLKEAPVHDKTAFLALNDGFSTQSIAKLLADYLEGAFSRPAPWEREHPNTELPRPLLHRAMDVVLQVSSCAAICPAVRSAASLGFPFAVQGDHGSRLFVITPPSAEPCSRQCRGGRRGHRGLYTSLSDKVVLLNFSTTNAAPLSLVAQICAHVRADASPDTCLLRAGKQLSTESQAVPRPLIVVDTVDPIFGECVMQRYLRTLEGVSNAGPSSEAPVLVTSLYQRPRVGEPRPQQAALALRVPPGSGDAYLETFPVPASSYYETKLP